MEEVRVEEARGPSHGHDAAGAAPAKALGKRVLGALEAQAGDRRAGLGPGPAEPAGMRGERP